MIAHPFPFEHPATEHHTFTADKDGMEGDQYRFKFANGCGASVIRHSYSYGSGAGLWELAVMDHEGRLRYDTPLTDDVIGYQTEQQIAVLLDRICRLEVKS